MKNLLLKIKNFLSKKLFSEEPPLEYAPYVEVTKPKTPRKRVTNTKPTPMAIYKKRKKRTTGKLKA